MSDRFDYVVVGGGSAGCVLAARLSEDPTVSVCLLEAGGPDSNVLIHAPAGVAAILPTRIANWAYETVPQKGLNGRRGYQPRGKTLGGSSSINAMLYVRGHRSDYDHWAALGNAGWGYADVLPYFKRAENNEEFGDSEYHGRGGPLNVKQLSYKSSLSDAFLAACATHGLPRIADCNGPDQFGSFLYQVTHLKGERCSAAKAYLTPNLGRPNLKVVTHAHTTRVLFDDAKRACGVAYTQGGQALQVQAQREVVLSGGAFGSPQLLMLSGIGPGNLLQRHGIPVLHDLPGVGRNLQDHIDYVRSWRTHTEREAFGLSARGSVALTRALFEWRRQRTGPITSTFCEGGAFFRSSPEVAVPDLQLIFVIGMVDDHNRKMHLGHGISCHVDVIHPRSRGEVTLASADEHDLAVLLKGAKLQQAIIESAPFDGFRGKMLYPVDRNDDAALIADIRARADTQYHPVGTCKMGPASDAMAVVDEQLRVRGVQGLRVVDASIMPTITGGNTNAPTIMVGEKAADLMRGLVRSRALPEDDP